jgi:hypothetical protein
MVEIPEHYVEVRIISRSGHELPAHLVERIMKKYADEINKELNALCDE